MGSKLRYGPRFGPGIADARYRFDDNLAEDMHRDNMRRAGMIKNLPLHKRELMYYESAKKGAATVDRKNGDEKRGRHEAEVRMVEAVRKVVEILEFHMHGLMEYRQVGGTEVLVSQHNVHNVLVMLRNSCGVKFPPNPEYEHRIKLDRTHLEPEQIIDERELKMTEQRLAREKRMRDITDRLINRPKH